MKSGDNQETKAFSVPYDEDEELDRLADEDWKPEEVLREWKSSFSGGKQIRTERVDPFTQNLQESFRAFREEIRECMENYRRDVGIDPGEYRTENKWKSLEDLDDLQFDGSLLDETRVMPYEQVKHLHSSNGNG